MKKINLKSWGMFLLAVMTVGMFVSCGDDDDEGGSGKFSIVGTWYEYEEDQEGLDAIWVFKSDKTGTVEEFYHGESEGVDNIKYKFEKNTLYIYYEGEEDDPSVLPISIVSSIEFTWSDGEDKLTFKKQK